MFESARLKIERARHHIIDLNGQIDIFLSEKPFSLVVKKDPDAGKRTISIKTKKPIPGLFSIVIGDAVHNLRSALDHIVFELVGEKTLLPEKIQFPFCKKLDDLDNTIKKRQIEFAGKKVINAIRSLRPYSGGNESLYGLHVLDISDKHKLILPVRGIASLRADEWRKIDPALGIISGEAVLAIANMNEKPIIDIPLTFTNRQARRAALHFEGETKNQPIFTMCFGHGQPFSGELVITRLLESVRVVEGAIECH